MKTLFCSAGEASGDTLGASLIKDLHLIDPTMKIMAIAGPHMRNQMSQTQCATLFPMEDLSVMGFSAVLAKLPTIISRFYDARRAILELNPDACVFIDYPGFHLRLETSLRSHGYRGKIIHYVAPQVFAHGKKRIEQMRSSCDLLLSIFPFDKEHFSQSGLQTIYVGNPLVEALSALPSQTRKKNLISLFPGSRQQAVEHNLPLMLEVMAFLPEQSFAISCANNALKRRVEALCREKGIVAELFDQNSNASMMQKSAAALACSGTITLELAILGCPTVVMYKLSFINFLFAKCILRLNLPYYSLANLCASAMLFEEHIGLRLSPKLIARDLGRILAPEEALYIQRAAQTLKNSFGSAPSAAKVVYEAMV